MPGKTEIGLDTRVTRSPEMLASSIDGEVVMLSVTDGKYYGMEEIGSRIWELLDTPRKVSELCELLMREFDVEAAQCERDVLTFLNDLLNKSVIETKGASKEE